MANNEDASVEDKKSTAKKSVAKQAESRGSAKPDHVTVDEMHELLSILRQGLESRDKAVDYLQTQIALNQEQIEQNKKILAKRGLIYKLTFVLLALGVLVVGFDQHTIVRSFDKDMTNVSKDMDKMLVEMMEMRKAIESMSVDMHTMSNHFGQVSKDVSSIDRSVTTMTQDVKSMSHGVRGMAYDTRQMNRNMDDVLPQFTPW